MLNLTLCLVLLGIVAIGVLLSLYRGVKRSRIRALMILGCGIASLVLTVLLRGMILTDGVMDKNILPFLDGLGTDMSLVVEMLNISPTLNDVLANTITSLVTPFLCVILFLVLCFFTWIVYLALNIRKQEAKFSVLRSIAWGAAQGLICGVIFLIPVATYMEYAPIVADCVLEADLLTREQEVYLQESMENVASANKGILGVYRTLGGKQICKLLGNFKVNDQTVVMADEIDSVASFGISVYRLAKSPIASYGNSEVAALNAISDSFEDSILLPTIAGEIIYDVTQKWMNGDSFFGVAKPSFGDMNEAFDPLFTRLLSVLNADAHNTEALRADFATVADMIATLTKNGVFANLSNTDQLLNMLAQNEVVTQLIFSLGENQNMKVLIPEINKFGMRIIATTLGVPENADEIYNSFIDDVVVALNEVRSLESEQQLETLSNKLITAFDEAGIMVDSVLIDCYSASMITDLVNRTELTTKQDVQDFFTLLTLSMEQESVPQDSDPTEPIVYRESVALSASKSNQMISGSAYADLTDEQIKKTGAAILANALKTLKNEQTVGQEAGTVLVTVYADLLVDAPETLEKLGTVELKAAISEETITVSASLNSAETVKQVTRKITLDDLLIDADAAAATITSETITKEAEAISAIFNAANELKTQLNQESEVKLDEIAGAVGNILDSLGQTETFGSDKTADLFTAVLQSETVRDAADLDLKTATDMANSATDSSKGEVSYTQTLTVVSGSISVVTKLGQNGEKVAEEELVELIRNLNPQTSGMIEIYVTTERMESYNVPADKSETTAQMIRAVFHYMANESLSDYDAEAKALNQVLTIALSAKDHSSAENLYTKNGVEGVLPGNAYETVTIFLGSDAITYALRTTILDENGVVIEEKRDAFGWGKSMSPDSDGYKDTVEAIKTYYQEHKDEQTKLDLEAFAAMLGVDAAEAGVFN